jgi:pimeloyl-ACP methyl ester carboxylesterase
MHRSPAKDAILMIHGLCCSGEVWDRAARLFRERDWRVETPTIHPRLRVASLPDPSLAKLSLADYVRDMEQAVHRIQADTGRLPVVFGHSLGGLIAQKLAERNLVRAAVLFAPTPPATGGSRKRPRLSTRITLANFLLMRDLTTKPVKIWKTGFRWGMWHQVPRQRHAALYATTRFCSGLVVRDLMQPAADPQRMAYIDVSRIAVPILTVGAGRDRVVPIEVQRAIAAKYRAVDADYLEYADRSHWLIDEPGMEQWVQGVTSWLNTKVV